MYAHEIHGLEACAESGVVEEHVAEGAAGDAGAVAAHFGVHRVPSLAHVYGVEFPEQHLHHTKELVNLRHRLYFRAGPGLVIVEVVVGEGRRVPNNL